MGGSRTKDLNYTEPQLRLIWELMQKETGRLEAELAGLAQHGYHWSDDQARVLRMRKRVAEAIAAKVSESVQGWSDNWTRKELDPLTSSRELAQAPR